MLPILLVSASAGIVFILGAIHLTYTFTTNKLSPRDFRLTQQMRECSPVISRHTTMWRAWVGFNASHSLGAMLFGAVYGYLTLFHFQLLSHSIFLIVVGAAFLSCMAVLARLYWFSIPFIGVGVSLVSYLTGFAVSMT